MLQGLVRVQRSVRAKLNSLKKAHRLSNIVILQAYVKKAVAKKNKEKVFGALQKIIDLIQKYRLRKNIHKYAVVYRTRQAILERAWMKIVLARKNIIQTYLQGFLVQIGQQQRIVTANHNAHQKFQRKYLAHLANYLHGFARTTLHETFMEQLRRTQRTICSWIHRQRFLKLKKAAITIQRAYREYYFNKNTAR